LFSERISLRKFLGVLIGFVSIAVLLSSKHPIFDEALHFKIFSLPVLAAFGSVIIGRYGWILTQGLLKQHRYHPAEINGISMLGSGIFAFCTAFLTGDIVSLTSVLNLKMMGLFGYTVIIGNIIAYTMIAHFLKYNPVTLISFLGFSVPIFSHFYGWIFLNEPLSWKFFLAVFCALIGFLIYKSPIRIKKENKEEYL
jgi:drug/metabolite transporter (DMT)-like permease